MATRLRARFGTQPKALGECAHHAWLGARTADEVRFAVSALSEAAKLAFRAMAFEEAQLLAERALELLARDGMMDWECRAELSLQRADALHGAGKLAAAIELYASVAEWAARYPSAHHFVEASLGLRAPTC